MPLVQGEATGLRVECEALPPTQWEPIGYALEEALGQPYTLHLRLRALEEPAADGASLLGAALRLVVLRGDQPVRRVTGVVVAAEEALAAAGDGWHLRVTVAPRVALLAHRVTQAVFCGRSVPDIVATRLKEHGLEADGVLGLVREYPARPFVLQYAESDLAFVQRLCEHVGITLAFDPDGDSDAVRLVDDTKHFAALPNRLRFSPGGERRGVYALSLRSRLVPGRTVVRDYNPDTPSVPVEGQMDSCFRGPGGVTEQGGNAATPREARALATLHGEARDAEHTRYHGEATLPELAAGLCVVLDEHPRVPATPLLVVRCSHTMDIDGTGARTVRVAFEAVHAQGPWRPPRVTARPVMPGVVTAHIVGPLGEVTGDTAQLDDQGRYFVRLQMDTRHHGAQPPSLRVRMIQNHVGTEYGTHLPLKPGVEVMVAFLDGDPDRPVIVGAVHDGARTAVVDASNPKVHRIRTATGVTLTMKDR